MKLQLTIFFKKVNVCVDLTLKTANQHADCEPDQQTQLFTQSESLAHLSTPVI